MPPTDARRVVVTGLGVVSPLGPLPIFWTRLTAGEHGIVPADAGTPHPVARVADWDPKQHAHTPGLRRADRLSRMLVSAAHMAIDDGRLALTPASAETVGLVVGTAYGNVTETDAFIRRVLAKGPALANPLTFPNTVLNASAGYAAMELGLRGPNVTLAHGEASGELAIATAYDLLRTGGADVVLAGAADELAPLLVDIYADLGLLAPPDDDPPWSRPFDRHRPGLVLGEGAAVLVLETAEHARARGATPYAELRGYATQTVATTAHAWPGPAAADPSELRRQLSALAWAPGDTTDLVISCANGTRQLDAFEIANLERLLGPAVETTTVTSVRGGVGDCGSTGALAAVAAALALWTGDTPRLGSLRDRAPGCRLRLAEPGATVAAASFGHVLVTASPRGGDCMVLLFGRP